MTLADKGCLQCAPSCKPCRTQQALHLPAHNVASLPSGLQPPRPKAWSNQLDRDQNATICVLFAVVWPRCETSNKLMLATACPVIATLQPNFCTVAAELPFQILSALHCTTV